MDTIKNYLENIFEALPKTEEILRLKNDLYSDMEAKYHELRQAGKTENEAIGKVIGEFGNINELLDELGIIAVDKDAATVVTMEKAREFLAFSAKHSCLVGAGVFIIISAVALFIGLSEVLENLAAIPLLSGKGLGGFPVVLLLLMIIPAVALFIYSGTLEEKFKFIKEGLFDLERTTEAILKEEMAELKPRWTVAIIVGVSLCIFSAAVLIVISGFGESFDSLGVCLLLFIVAVAVFIFIRTGGSSEAYETLLKLGEFAPEEKRAGKVIGAVASFVWPIAVCVFLIWGFMYNGWGISWIVFPVTGILFGGFASVYSALSKK